MSSKRTAMLAEVALDNGVSPPPSSRRTGTEQLRIFANRIVPNPDQPRKVFDEPALLRLAADVRERGQLQPIRVRPANEHGFHQIIMGERRWRACEKADIEILDCVVDYDVVSADDAYDLAIAENIQRQDLTRPELAAALTRVRQRHGLTIAQLAERYNMSEEWVSDQLAYGNLSPEAQGLMEQRNVATAVAQALRGLDEADQAPVLQAVVELPNRTAQLARIGQVKDLKRSGIALDDAISGAVEAAPPHAGPVRRPGRPSRVDPDAAAFVWRPIASREGGDMAILQTRFARLQIASRGLSLREGVVQIYLEMLEEDLRALHGACSARPDGDEVWTTVTDRLRLITELPRAAEPYDSNPSSSSSGEGEIGRPPRGLRGARLGPGRRSTG